jgi:hypothetical protein
MSEIANARIKAFGISPKDGFVTPSEQLITLTIGQLQELVTQAVEKAIQPLQDRISSLEDRRSARLEEENAALIATQEQDVTRICLDIALDRQRISRLEHPTKNPGKTETARAEKIEKYLASRPDHRVSFEALRGFLEVNAVLLNLAIAALMKDAPGQYAIVKDRSDKRKRFLAVIPKIS